MTKKNQKGCCFLGCLTCFFDFYFFWKFLIEAKTNRGLFRCMLKIQPNLAKKTSCRKWVKMGKKWIMLNNEQTTHPKLPNRPSSRHRLSPRFAFRWVVFLLFNQKTPMLNNEQTTHPKLPSRHRLSPHFFFKFPKRWKKVSRFLVV